MVIGVYINNFKFIRKVERNEILHIVKKVGQKLKCDCGDDVFYGIPCRHLVAVVSKVLNNNFDMLLFNKRWKKKTI